MSNLFVITASNQAAQSHIRDTIDRSIPVEKVEKHFAATELERVKKIGREYGYYAWGAVPGKKNIPTWEKIQTGDHLLIYQNKTYTYYAKVLFKARNKTFATDNWGQDNEGGTWEYMYLLEKPIKFTSPISAAALAEYLPPSYMGFMQITGERISRITSNYGSLENYLSKSFPDLSGFATDGRPNYWWVCQGKSYEIGRGGGFIWAPNKDRGGGLPSHWASMRLVEKGDVIFNYANTSIRAISIAKAKSYNFENKSAIDNWQTNGQRVDLDYYDIDPIDIAKIQPYSAEIVTAISSDNPPLNRIGGVKQGYLFNFSFEAAKIIRKIYGKPFPAPIEKLFGESSISYEFIGNVDKIALLKTKKQIIFYGPPGTGKTYYTKEMAINLLEDRR